MMMMDDELWSGMMKNESDASEADDKKYNNKYVVDKAVIGWGSKCVIMNKRLNNRLEMTKYIFLQ